MPNINLLPYLEASLRQISELRLEKDASAESPAFIEWQELVEGLIARQFGENSREAKSFGRISFEVYAKGLTRAESKLKSLIKLMAVEGGNEGLNGGSGLGAAPQIHIHNSNSQTQDQSQRQEVKINSEKLFEDLLAYVKENHPAKVEEAKAVLAPLKPAGGGQMNVTFEKIKSAIQFFLPMGEQAFKLFAPVLAQVYATNPWVIQGLMSKT